MKNNVYDYVINNINVLLTNGIEYYQSVDEDYKSKLESIYRYINSEEEEIEEVTSLEEKAAEVKGLSDSYLDKMTDIKISVLNVENDMESLKESIEAKDLYVTEENYEPTYNIYEDESDNDSDFVIETPISEEREEIIYDEVPNEELYFVDKPNFSFDKNGVVVYDRKASLDKYKFDKNGILIADESISSSDIPSFESSEENIDDENAITVELKNSVLKYKFDENGVVVFDREYDLSQYRFDENGVLIEDRHIIDNEPSEEDLKHDELGNVIEGIDQVKPINTAFKFDEFGNVIYDKNTPIVERKIINNKFNKKSDFTFNADGIVTNDNKYILSQFRFDSNGSVIYTNILNKVEPTEEESVEENFVEVVTEAPSKEVTVDKDIYLFNEQGLNYVMGNVTNEKPVTLNIKTEEAIEEVNPVEDSVEEETQIEETVVEVVQAEEPAEEETPTEEPVEKEVQAEEPVEEEVQTEEPVEEEAPAEEPVEEETPTEEPVEEETPAEEPVEEETTTKESTEETSALGDLFSDDFFEPEKKVSVKVEDPIIGVEEDSDDSSSSTEKILDFNFEEIISNGESIDEKEEEIEIKQEEPVEETDELIIVEEKPKKKSFFDLFKRK